MTTYIVFLQQYVLLRGYEVICDLMHHIWWVLVYYIRHFRGALAY